MNESTVRTFRKRYESDLADAKRQGKTPFTSPLLKPQGGPFLLGEIDKIVQRFILAASNQGSVITRGIAVSTAKALLTRNHILLAMWMSSHRIGRKACIAECVFIVTKLQHQNWKYLRAH